MKFLLALCLLASSVGIAATTVHADELRNVKKSGVLRCGVMLDFPPAGFWNKQHEPAGFDVDYCRALAAALKVSARIVETPSPERIPALMSGRVDVSVAGASITAARASTVDFSRPYTQYPFVVVTKQGIGIKSFGDLKSHRVGGVSGTVPEIKLKQFADQNWDGKLNYISYNSDSEQNLALSEGKIDGFVTVITTAAVVRSLPQFSSFEICCTAPFAPDVDGLMIRKGNAAFLSQLNAFIAHEIESGDYAKLYQKWYGLQAPALPATAQEVINRG